MYLIDEAKPALALPYNKEFLKGTATISEDRQYHRSSKKLPVM